MNVHFFNVMSFCSEYIIEAQDMDEKGRFVQVGTVKNGETKFNVKGLKNKANYKFRVKAKNKEGVSDPLSTEQYTTIKDPWGKLYHAVPKVRVQAKKILMTVFISGHGNIYVSRKSARSGLSHRCAHSLSAAATLQG